MFAYTVNILESKSQASFVMNLEYVTFCQRSLFTTFPVLWTPRTSFK